MRRVLITGGAGFIGSHLCEHFLDRDWEVICMDNLLTGNYENIAHLEGVKNFTFIRHDITDYILIKGSLDAIMHLASPASPVDYLKMPITTMKVGAMGTHKVLGLAKDKGAVVLLASTSEVYGDPLVHPQPETYWGNVNPIGPRGVYDEAKRFAEALVMAYQHYHGMETRIARIFNTYGPRMRKDDGRVVPTFICQALKGEDLTVFGNGLQTRSFCYISDMCEGLYRLLLSNYAGPVNLGNPEEMTILDFAKKLVDVLGSDSGIVFRPLPVDDPHVRQPDITLAKKLLGWQPKKSLVDGLKETVEFFRAQLVREGEIEK